MSADDRRLILAFLLSMVVFLGYQYFVTKQYPVKSISPTPLASDTGAIDGAPGVTAARNDARNDAARAEIRKLLSSSPDAEDTVTLEGDGFLLTATSRGAGIRQIQLTGIPRHPHVDTRDVILVDPFWPYPFAAVHAPGTPAGAGPPNFQKMKSDAGSVTFRMDIADPDGRKPLLRIDRTVARGKGRYEIRLETRVRNLSGQSLTIGSDTAQAFGIGLAPFPVKRPKTDLDIHEIFLKLGGDVEHRQEESPGFFSKFSGQSNHPQEARRETLDGVLKWISLGDRYFTLTLIPDSPLSHADLFLEGSSITADARYGTWTLDAGQERMFQERLYAGPKLPEHLKLYGEDILDIMNFGWFDWLGFGMLGLMNLFYRVISNYGVGIILMTVVVRIVLYPLTYKSYTSMAKLKDLAPKMKTIQDKYKDNREKLNREMLKMYKDNKVNPAGGCLPILLQIPVFIAFYRMLQYSIELRGASFAWVPDLSEKDPLYILPVLMGIAMLIQQKMTPTPDPNQAKIGMFMTAIFTVLFLTFPGGLNLYWFVSTVLGILQQKMIERKMKPSVAAPIQAAT